MVSFDRRPGTSTYVCPVAYSLAYEFKNVAISLQLTERTVDRIASNRFTHAANSSSSRLSEQRAIAHILGTLDDKIELNRRMNETLEAIARAIFKSWFVDFDPVRAKAEGRDTGLPPHIADLFPDSFEDSELGEIPSEWRTSTLRDVTSKIGSGATPRGGSSVYVEDGVAIDPQPECVRIQVRMGRLGQDHG